MPHLDVTVRAAHLLSNGIEVRGLSIAEPGAPGPQSELAFFDTLLLECDTSPQELFSGEPVVTRITVSRPVFRATRRPDGTYSLSKLFPLPKPPGPPPPVTIEGGVIEVFDPLRNPPSMFVLRDLNVTIKPDSSATERWPKLDVQGYVVGDQIRRVEFTARVDPAQGHWDARGEVDGLDISPELRGALPGPVADRCELLCGLRAPASLHFHVVHDGQPTPRFEVDGSLARGRIEDARLPYPLTDVRGNFHFDNAGFVISELAARDGPTLWEIKRFVQRGYAPHSPFALHLGGQQVHLDARWAVTLPEPLNKYWQYYNPAGDINLDCMLEFDGERYYPKQVDAVCLNNVSFSFHKFPYRLEQARGSLRMQDDVLSVQMTAYAGPQPVALRGSFTHPGPEYTGWIEVRADKIAFDDKLFAAVLRPVSHDALVALNPAGTFNVYAKLMRTDPRIREMRQYAEVTLDAANHCKITYDKFPFPLTNVEGKLVLQDGEWNFQDVAGTNGPGVVRLSGRIATLSGAKPMGVEIHAQNIELGDELRAAFQPGMRRLWDALQPHGKVDANATVSFAALGAKPTVRLQAVPHDDATSIGTSIEPVAFPYRMRLSGGRIEYQDGHAELHGIRAAHGSTEIRTEGTCDIWPDGGWQLSLQDLTVNRIRLQGDDHDLVAALPGALRRAVGELKPGGPINLKGALDFARRQPTAPLHVGWDVDLFMFDGSLQVGPCLENIFGRVRLRGMASGANYSSQGELDVDSLTYKNFQFTSVAGPLSFDNAYVFLGSAHSGRPARPGRRAASRPTCWAARWPAIARCAWAPSHNTSSTPRSRRPTCGNFPARTCPATKSLTARSPPPCNSPAHPGRAIFPARAPSTSATPTCTTCR